MADDATSLLDRIRALVVEETSGAPDGLLGRIEHTLTDGYAQALALEGERLRLEKEIGAVVARLRQGDDVATLVALAGRRDAASRDLTRLRELLELLSQRAEAVRGTLERRRALHEAASDGVDGGLDPVLDL
jgi:hypothetical protein